MPTLREKREINHGKILASGDPEVVWGWGTPAGKLRFTRRANMISARASLSAGATVLELGCGTGNFTAVFANTGANLVSIELSHDLLVIARRNLLLSPNITFIEGSFESYSAVGTFDAVIGSSVLHHLDIDYSLRKMYTFLKPGGVICFAEPNMLNPQIFIQKNIPWIKEKMGDTPDETAFIRWSIKHKLIRYGFTNVSVIPFDWLHPATPAMLIPTICQIGRVLENIPLIKEFAGSLLIWAYRPEEADTGLRNNAEPQ